MTASTIDGFAEKDKDAYVAFSPQTSDRFYDVVDRLARRLHAEVEGIERLPAGRAILVANHAFGWEVVVPMAAIHRATGRTVWALGEHAWWKVPLVRRFAAAVGVVDGTPANVDRLLAREELVLVLPGGLREAVKPRELRYRLLWGHRYGFVRAAIAQGAPLVPVACIGVDDAFDFFGDAYARGRRWLHRDFPIPLPTRILPIPHRVHLRYVIGEPIQPDVPPERADDPVALHALRRQVEGALHELIERELAQRAGMEVD